MPQPLPLFRVKADDDDIFCLVRVGSKHEGGVSMPDHKEQKKPEFVLPDTLIDLLITDVFRRNGIQLKQSRPELSPDQKQQLKNLVEDLRKQVEKFTNPSPEK
jgi:spore coat protein W